MSVHSILLVIALTIGKGSALRSRRFIIDGLTGWSSWEQYAACSVNCMSLYEGELKHCCETGNNRACYNLPWDIIKPYVGTCANSTTTSPTSSMRTTGLSNTTPRKTTLQTIPSSPTQTISSTRPSTTTWLERTSSTRTTRYTPAQVTTSRTTRYTPAQVTTSRTKVTTTLPHFRTLPPVPTVCKVCAGPEFLCEKLFMDKQCEYPNNYCINRLVNHLDGSRSVIRSCGNFDTCYRDYFLGSSDSDKCRAFDENGVLTLDFSCTYCCVTDNCNLPIRPDESTLYHDV